MAEAHLGVVVLAQPHCLTTGFPCFLLALTLHLWVASSVHLLESLAGLFFSTVDCTT